MDERIKKAADELLESVREVEMEFKDHRADDDFERMLAELNGKRNAKKASEPAPVKAQEEKSAPEAKADASAKQPDEAKAETQPDAPKPEKKPDRRKKLPPRPEKTQAQLEKERKEKAEAEERERKKKQEEEDRKRNAAIERERRENEAKLVKQISDIWDNPALAEGGRLSMKIKTDQRKAIRITIPPEVRRKAEMEQKQMLEKQAELKQQQEKQQTPQKPSEPEEKAKTLKSEPDEHDKPADTVKPDETAKSDKSAKPDETAKLAKSDKAANTVKENLSPEPVIKKEDRIKNKSELIASAAASGVLKEEKTIEMKRINPENVKPMKKPAERKAVPAYAAAVFPQVQPVPDVKAMPKKTHGTVKKTVQAKPSAETVSLSSEDIRTKQFAIINVIVCCAIFFGLGLYMLFCTRQSGFIQSENRNLAEKPKLTVESLIDGSYFADLTVWYTDTIPGREELKPFSARFTKLFGITLNDVKITGGLTPSVKESLDSKPVTTTEVTINTNFDEIKKTTTNKKKTETEKLAEVPDELDDGEWLGSVVVSGKGKKVRAMSAFNGTFAQGKKYAETINKYRETLGSSINIYTMNMPISSAYYMPDNLKDQFASQHDCITNIGNNLAGIMNVDVYDALDSHKDEYIYSRTDHHWQPLGAYYAAKVFADRAQFDFPDLNTYTEHRIENFVGTMYAYSNYDEELNNNPDTFIYHKPDNNDSLNVTIYDESFSDPRSGMLFHDYASGVNCYSAILGTDDIIAEIETNVKNRRTLVIIKDSFGNALVPYLTHGFEKIYVVDFRYFDINAADFIRQVGATDLLFAVSITAAHTESHVNAIGNIRIQVPEPADVVLPEDTLPDTPDEIDGNGYDTDYNEDPYYDENDYGYEDQQW